MTTGTVPSHRSSFFSPSKLVLIAANVVLYAALIDWVRTHVALDKLVGYISQVSPAALVASIVIDLCSLTLYGKRMSLLIGTELRIGFAITNIGYALNALIPLRLGEALKLYVARRLFGLSLMSLLSSSVAEKFADLFKLLLLSLVVVVFAAAHFVDVAVVLTLVAILGVGIGVLAVFLRNTPRLLKLLPKGGHARRKVIELHKHLRGYPIMKILYVSFGIWALNVTVVYFSFNTYLPQIEIGVLDAAAILVILSLAIAIPSAPAGIGLYETGIVVYLTQICAVPPEIALAAATVFHSAVTIPQLLLAAIIFGVATVAKRLRASQSEKA